MTCIRVCFVRIVTCTTFWFVSFVLFVSFVWLDGFVWLVTWMIYSTCDLSDLFVLWLCSIDLQAPFRVRKFDSFSNVTSDISWSKYSFQVFWRSSYPGLLLDQRRRCPSPCLHRPVDRPDDNNAEFGDQFPAPPCLVHQSNRHLDDHVSPLRLCRPHRIRLRQRGCVERGSNQNPDRPASHVTNSRRREDQECRLFHFLSFNFSSFRESTTYIIYLYNSLSFRGVARGSGRGEPPRAPVWKGRKWCQQVVQSYCFSKKYCYLTFWRPHFDKKQIRSSKNMEMLGPDGPPPPTTKNRPTKKFNLFLNSQILWII